nr:zf-CCHC domain-containing protein/UBN2 domain-containing protein [Tanacetum cinerariifolium]
KKVGTSQRVDTSEDTVMDDASNQGRIIDEMDKDDAVALMDGEEEDKKEEEANVVEDDQEDEPAEVHEVVDVVTTAKLIIEVVTAASITISIAEPKVLAATITAAPSKNKGKWIMVEEPKPLKKKQQVEMDEEYARKLHAELNKDIDWDVAIEHVKQKAKEDLVDVVGFRLDYFKGMSYDDMRLIFKAKFNSNIEFLIKTKEQMEEEESRAIQSINETPVQKVAKRRKLNEEVEDLKRHLEIMPDEDDDVYTEATPLARKNFDREELEALWNLVKERFSTSKPKNFSNDLLLNTLGAKVKSWKLLESCVFNAVGEELSAAKQKMMLLDNAAEGNLMLLKESIDSGFARFNTNITSLKALDEGFSSKNYVRKFLRVLHPKWRAKVTAIEELKDLPSLALDELIRNLKVHEVVMKKDSEIYKGKKERNKSIILKAKKESSDDETSTSESDDEEYAMVVRNFKKFFRRKGKFVRQPREERMSLRQRDEKKGKSDRECFICGDLSHLIGDCPKTSRNKDQKAFIGGSWSDSENDVEDKTNDKTCLMAQSSNEAALNSFCYSDNTSSLDNDNMKIE